MPALLVNPEDRAARRVGSVLAGKYGVERLIGVGGMATVYAGVHRNGRRVAIKILHDELGIHAEVRRRFVREGYVANAVGHAGAVHVYDDDTTADGAPFLVMELLEGETLAERCRRCGGTLPARDVLALGHQLLDVLAAAHARGVIHRDIKPDNLFLTTAGVLKVLDFGVARMLDDPGSQVTVTGARIGTPSFMPPEQALGRSAEIDGRTDVWGAGATLFSLIAGRTPHVAENAAELIVITATTPARSILEHSPELAPSIADALDRAIAFKREDRWDDARAMQRALEEAHREVFGEPLDPSAVGPLPLPRPRVSRALASKATLAAPRAKPGTTMRDPAKSRATVPGSPTAATMVSLLPTPATLVPTAKDVTPPPGFASQAEESLEDTSDSTFDDDEVGGPIFHFDWPSDPDHDSLGPGGARPSAPSQPSSLPASPRESVSPENASLDSPQDSRSPAPPPSRVPRSRVLSLLAAAAAVAGVSFAVARWTAGSHSDPPSGGGPARGTSMSAVSSAGPAASGGPARECEVNADCHSSEPSICRKADGVCVQLTTDQCKVLASPGDVENDATIWVGAMFPLDGATRKDGIQSADMVELARRDFAQMSGGLLPVKPGGPRRPIAVVLCDDHEDPERAARHLALDVRVPAILGFGVSKEVMALTTSVFNPHGVLALAANTASSLRELPPGPSGDRMVWRVTSSADMTVPVVAALLADVVEPAIRAQPGGPAAGEPVRLALLRVADPIGQAYADNVASVVRVNGRSIVDNGESYQQFVGDSWLSKSSEAADRVAASVVAFRPHAVVQVVAEDVLIRIEKSWPESAGPRPFHVAPTSYLGDAMRAWVKGHPELRSRYFGIDSVTSPDLAQKLLIHHNETFSRPVDLSTLQSQVYDAFYVFAYAAAASSADPLTGVSLSRALPRLLPGGTPVNVGPGEIYTALYALAQGKNIDLQGAMTNLDFDLRTGDAGIDFGVYCLTPPDATGTVRALPVDLVFPASTKKLRGSARCK
ncbi:MAG: protein kinase [Polyangiaceae bacterium]